MALPLTGAMDPRLRGDDGRRFFTDVIFTSAFESPWSRGFSHRGAIKPRNFWSFK